MDDDAAFLALENIREETVCEFVAEIAKIERFLFGTLPFMLGRFELVSHYFVLHRSFSQRFWLQHQKTSHQSYQNSHHYRNCKQNHA